MLCAIAFSAYTQSVGIGTSTPNASAQLDISSTGRGLLIPRMNSAAINAIPNPAKGLMVLDTAKNQLVFNIGTPAAPNWQSIAFSSGWTTTGNAGTDTSKNFIGTTDDKDLVFKRNNIRSGLINQSDNSTSWGYGAMNSNHTGFNNTAIGKEAMGFLTTGSNNTATGFRALYRNTSGTSNVADGSAALFNNTSGSLNIAQGNQALWTNTSGNSNVAVGHKALHNNYSGFSNIAIGTEALYNNTIRNNLVAIGDSALFNNGAGAPVASEAQFNVAVGSKAMYTNVAGYANTAIGFETLKSNSNGDGNAALGFKALNQQSTGNSNTGVGAYAGLENISGSSNVFLGYQAGQHETGSNRLYISNGDSTESNALIYGEFDNKLLKINGSLTINAAPGAPGLDIGSAAIRVSGTNPSVFTVTATAAVLDLVIPTTTMANSSTDILIVTHRLSGTKLNSSPGVYWNGTNWVIFLENFGNHIVGEQYNVMVIKQ